jgi:hypothetical protein
MTPLASTLRADFFLQKEHPDARNTSSELSEDSSTSNPKERNFKVINESTSVFLKSNSNLKTYSRRRLFKEEVKAGDNVNGLKENDIRSKLHIFAEKKGQIY